jgi:hypothetical protein
MSPWDRPDFTGRRLARICPEAAIVPMWHESCFLFPQSSKRKYTGIAAEVVDDYRGEMIGYTRFMRRNRGSNRIQQGFSRPEGIV